MSLTQTANVVGGKQYLDPAMNGASLAGYAGDLSSNPGSQQPQLSKRRGGYPAADCLGYKNKEIAVRCYINVKTVEAHGANAMRKLYLYSRTDIVRHVFMQGWLRD